MRQKMSHIKKCATLEKEKMRHAWKKAPHLQKCTLLGKVRHTWDNAQIWKSHPTFT